MPMSYQALVIEHSLRAGALSRCEGTMRTAAPFKPSCGRPERLAGVNMLHGVGGAATIEQVNMKEEWQTAAIAVSAALRHQCQQTAILYAPNPEGK